MIHTLAGVLATVYAPMMWALVVVFAVLGVMGVLAPQRLRTITQAFTTNHVVRIFGVAILAVGAQVFIRAKVMSIPILMKSLGVFLFVDGGVCLLIPTLCVIIAERAVTWPDRWYRLGGLVCFGLAYAAFLAAGLPLTT